jgi:hypothetical protein
VRLWSLHPKYLDAKGLVALWRKGLLALKVLENRTQGYRHHPQLIRFKNSSAPLVSIKSYLHIVCDVADDRGYAFNRSKLGARRPARSAIPVSSGQIDYEWEHLQKKLQVRSPAAFLKNASVKKPQVHPRFRRRPGPIEDWENVISKSDYFSANNIGYRSDSRR